MQWNALSYSRMTAERNGSGQAERPESVSGKRKIIEKETRERQWSGAQIGMNSYGPNQMEGKSKYSWKNIPGSACSNFKKS